MDNTKIGNREAIALLVTIMFNHFILNVTKTIINSTLSSSLLNILYISIVTIIFTCIICYFLNKFPTYDILDISHYLGGDLLKWIIGLAYIAYFIFFSGNLLNIFSSCLQIIYFPLTKVFYIALFFIICATIACNMKNNAVFRSTLVFFPLIIISTLFVFVSDIPFYRIGKIYPILGNGISATFLSGLCNMFAFQGLAYIYFMPPKLKDPNKVKHVAVTSIIISSILLLIIVAIVLFMFSGFVETDELMPLYSAVKYIEYGAFFQKMDSIFVLTWIISFVSYLSITLKFSSRILKKLTQYENTSIFTFLLAIGILIVSTWKRDYAISILLSDKLYKYSFFILVVGISFCVLLFSTIKQKVRKWFK